MLKAFSFRFLLAVIILLVSSRIAYAADVVINEVFANPVDESNEYIELYNTTDHEIDISNWKVSDKVKTYTVSSQSIGAKGFVSLKKSTTTIELNNSSEDVTLKDSNDSTIDSFSYADTIQGKSWSRFPDGTGSFVNNTNPTEASANSAPPPTNTTTPTKTPTPTPIKSGPTNTPTPTKAPTSAPTTRSTSSGQATPTPTKIQDIATPIKSGPTTTPTLRPSDGSDLRLGSEENNNIFGDSGASSPTPEAQVLGVSSVNFPLAYIGLGLIFLVVCGILLYFQFGQKLFPRFMRKPKVE